MSAALSIEQIKAKQAAFLGGLSQNGHVLEAARAAKVARALVYLWRKEDTAFAEAWDDAIEMFVDKLEREAYRRGIEGYDEDVFYKGVKMATQRKYSDSLLALTLKGNRAKYRESRVEVANAAGETFRVEMTPTEAARQIAFSLALGLKAAEDAHEEGADLA